MNDWLADIGQRRSEIQKSGYKTLPNSDFFFLIWVSFKAMSTFDLCIYLYGIMFIHVCIIPAKKTPNIAPGLLLY